MGNLGLMIHGIIKRSSFDSLKSGGGEAGPQPCLEGWGDKITSNLKKDLEQFQSKLKVGDIINTNPRQPLGPLRAFKYLSKKYQGTKFGHSALYDGKGNVIEGRGETIIKRPLSDLARCNELLAVSPKNVNEKDRIKAVKWMNKNIGNDAMKITVKGMIVHGVRPTFLSRMQGGHKKKKQKINIAICSSLIANAYEKIPFNPKRRIVDTRPMDIINSDKVKVVAELK